jgi:hypothetical protein
METEFARDPNTRSAVDQLDGAAWEPRISAWFEIRQLFDEMIEKVMVLEREDPDTIRKILRESNEITTSILRDE